MALYLVNFSVSTNEDWVDTLALVTDAGEETEAPVDLSGSSFRMQIRPFPEKLLVLLELTTENGRLVIEPDPEDVGKLTVLVPRTTVDDLDPGTYPYDLVWTMVDGRKVNLAAGIVTINLGITR